jgi:hypothetical protein
MVPSIDTEAKTDPSAEKTTLVTIQMRPFRIGRSDPVETRKPDTEGLIHDRHATFAELFKDVIAADGLSDDILHVISLVNQSVHGKKSEQMSHIREPLYLGIFLELYILLSFIK